MESVNEELDRPPALSLAQITPEGSELRDCRLKSPDTRAHGQDAQDSLQYASPKGGKTCSRVQQELRLHSEEPDVTAGGGMLHMYHRLWYSKVADCKLPSTRAAALDAYADDDLVAEDEGRYGTAIQRMFHELSPSLAVVAILLWPQPIPDFISSGSGSSQLLYCVGSLSDQPLAAAAVVHTKPWHIRLGCTEEKYCL